MAPRLPDTSIWGSSPFDPAQGGDDSFARFAAKTGLADDRAQMGPLSLQEAQSAADFSIAKDALYDKVLTEADHNQAPELYREAATAALQESAARIDDPVESRLFFEPRWFAIEANVNRLQARAAKRNTVDILRANDAQADALMKQGLEATREVDRRQKFRDAIELFRGERKSNLIDDDLLRVRINGYGEKFGEAWVEDLRRRAPDKLLEALNKAIPMRQVPIISAFDRDLLIRTVHGEAKGESEEGMAAVTHSIINRLKYDDRYANPWKYNGITVQAVVLHPKQYEPWNKKEKREEMEKLTPDDARYKRAAKVVDAVLAGEWPDPTPGSTHFYSVPVMENERGGLPTWAPKGFKGEYSQIGRHMFMRPDDLPGRTLARGTPADYLPIKRLIEHRSRTEVLVSALATDRERARVMAEREAQRVSDEETDRLVEAIIAERSTIGAKDIVDNPKLSFDAMMRMNNVRGRQPYSDPPTDASGLRAMELRERILLPDGHPSKITKADEIDEAYINRELGKGDFIALRRQFAESRTEEGKRLATGQADLINRVRGQVKTAQPRAADMDMAIELQLYRLGLDTQSKVDDYRKAGKNPHDLFDPSKPDYLGKPDIVAAYQATLHDRIRASGGVWLPKPKPAQIPPAAPSPER